MSSIRRALRLSLAAAAVLMLAVTAACSDSTGPNSGARPGYLTSSNAVNRGYNVPAGPTTNTGGAKTATPADTTTPNSGYNVTAF